MSSPELAGDSITWRRQGSRDLGIPVYHTTEGVFESSSVRRASGDGDDVMANRDALVTLRELRTTVEAGGVYADGTAAAFERLTILLEGMARVDEQLLHDMVNDVETILFTQLPANQRAAVVDVLARAEEVFERYA